MSSQFMDIEAVVALSRRFADTIEPKPAVVLLTGSALRGALVHESDVDLVALFQKVSDSAWRQTTDFEGQIFEVFAHDLQTLSYFCREIELPSAQPALAKMILEGIPVIDCDPALLKVARQRCETFLNAGPLPLRLESIASRRFAITELLSSVVNKPNREVQVASATALYASLSDFALRANKQWTATGKAVPGVLRNYDPDLADRFSDAFGEFFADGGSAKVAALVDEVLAPFGGRFRAGFRQDAPLNWRDPIGEPQI